MMKKLLTALVILLATASQAMAAKTMEDFTQYEAEKFPKSFRTYPFQRGKAQDVYVVKEENGNKFLHASDDKDVSVQVFKRFVWDTEKFPNFSWKWRPITLPKGGDERNGMPNDSACGIYVTFGGYTGNAIKYVWSTTLPVGTVVEKKPNKFYILVVASGPGQVGTWQTKAVNVMEDYRRIFKSEPKKTPDGFGILTDGNATHTPAVCDYDDFQISETPF